ncbi:hypothetical protein [Phenylobacterium sp. Root700]|uniref:hypothetical protein n=1 Tax=Phenylobacterium sp. Root700 TaxID=1736591 RepID=UPI0006FE6E28|nr:hypothetical protein [Phenylobacterium sp. Root700]KRB46639.1 serine/threonine protein phosphatase [Phenylobacterium sp. Root700]
MIGKTRRFVLALAATAALTAPAVAWSRDESFTLAVIPDTQNYVDYSHQTAEGFPFDARDLFFQQMRYIEGRLKANGGDIAFVTSLGDTWQHQTKKFDEAHAKFGVSAGANPILDTHFAPTDKTRTVEMPTAKQGFDIIAGKTPFSVVPGNHDYDAMWTDSRHLPIKDFMNPGDHPRPYGMLHPGGLDNWREVFGADTAFFKDKPWYVASYNGGADSAQIFTAGGYKFLHIGLEMAPSDDVLAWVAKVINDHRGLPTIISIHDHLNTNGERAPNPMVDMAMVHAEHNNPEAVWKKLLSRHDQIFLVLNGHQHGQAYRADPGAGGFAVHQLLADYQDRGQTAIAAGVKTAYPVGIGDGWMRFMTFDMSGATPAIRVRTYSTYYKAFSGDVPQYAAWYRGGEQPKLTDSEFLARDDFSIEIKDFRQRFGKPARH